MRFLLFFCVMACVAQPSLAQQTGAIDLATSSMTKREALGYEIARVTNSEPLTRLQLDKILEDTLPKQLAANPDFVELEAILPGVTEQLIDAMAPLVIKHSLARLPVLWGRLGTLYAKEFTAPELERVLEFYRSPVGIRVIDVMGRRSDFTRAMQQALNDPNAKLTAAGVKSGQQVGIRAISNELATEELAEIGRFEDSPVGLKLGALTSKFQQISADWGNEPMPEFDAEIEGVIQGVLAPYLNGGTNP